LLDPPPERLNATEIAARSRGYAASAYEIK
jgi:hypothetical protein